MSIAVDRDQAFLDAVTRIAANVAAPNADDVDRQARFPSESSAVRKLAIDSKVDRRKKRSGNSTSNASSSASITLTLACEVRPAA